MQWNIDCGRWDRRERNVEEDLQKCGSARHQGFSLYGGEGIGKLPEAERSEKNYFVIFKNVRTVGKLLDAGYKMPPVIEVGPTSSKAGGENIMRGLYLERDEMEIYSRLTDLGVEVGMQPIFTHPKEYWADLRKKYGL